MESAPPCLMSTPNVQHFHAVYTTHTHHPTPPPHHSLCNPSCKQALSHGLCGVCHMPLCGGTGGCIATPYRHGKTRPVTPSHALAPCLPQRCPSLLLTTLLSLCSQGSY
jgi:hypothetical protein